MTAVRVVVPWRPDGGYRDQVWKWCSAWWAKTYPSWPVTVGVDSGDGPWRKAVAVHDGIKDVPDGTIVVLADADVWCDGVAAAVAQVQDQVVQWAVPHRHVLRLTQRVTDGILAGRPVVDDVERAPYIGHQGGGIVVLPVEALRTYPMHPGFAGWGYEDDAAGLMWGRLLGPYWRGMRPLWHGWHPPQPEAAQEGSPENRVLYNRFVAADQSTTPEAMLDLAREARDLLSGQVPG